MRCLTLAVIAMTAGIVTPCLGEDSYVQTWHPSSASPSVQSSSRAPTYDDCFKLGWVRGVHVEREEWDDFYEQCAAGQVPFESGMAVDSVRPDRAGRTPTP
ncbi:MAG: hypothetical protein JSR72_12615 [Proteobacteria bacterium]|nr:hypothetical protein [Pseudomonadota bacterium]